MLPPYYEAFAVMIVKTFHSDDNRVWQKGTTPLPPPGLKHSKYTSGPIGLNLTLAAMFKLPKSHKYRTF